MNISYGWLKKYIDTDLSPQEVGDILTSIGLEVGTVTEHQSIKGGLAGIVIGKVKTCIPHPNSDHLKITTVDLGSKHTPDGPIQIVCGAPNVAAGQTVPVATIGTVLYDGDESFTIKKGRIRGEESFGMICAADEIGVGTNHDGIMVLPNDLPVGMPAAEYFDVKQDAIIEIDITANRIDATSHYGVARDLYAYLTTHGHKTQLHKPEVFSVEGSGEPIKLTVESPEACFRYSGVVIKGVKVTQSPKWLSDALELIGQKSINNVVDISNYVLQEIGQPLHTFDLSKIEGDHIHVRFARKDEKIVTLDHTEQELNEADLCICNDSEPMCIAGVMGGIDSSVTEETTDIFLECATFHPTYVRKTARRHGMNTDASFRYERGLDPEAVPYALARAVDLITQVAGGEVASRIYDYYPEPQGPFEVELSLQKVTNLIGIEISREKILEILDALEMKVVNEKDGILSLQVPRYRYDVTRDVDVIEDILRIYGYNEVPISNVISSSISPVTYTDKSIRMQQVISEQLVGAGFNEILNNSLSKAEYYQSEEDEKAAVKLLNPLSADLSTLRMSMVHGGLETIEYNLNRKANSLRLFEFGNIYRKAKESPSQQLRGYEETYTLALWMTGDELADNWSTPGKKQTPYELSAVLQNILGRSGLDRREYEITQEIDTPLFEKGEKITLKGGKTIGRWGVLSESLLNLHDIDTPVFYAEFLWDNLLKRVIDRTPKIKDVPRFPAVRRDFALVLDTHTTFSEVERVARSVEDKILQDVVLFDVYEDSSHLPEGKKSYAVAFTLQDPTKTLSDKVIDKTMKKIYSALEKELGAELR